ncbi:MAG: TetR/AcrR family transcriptional regulator [Planctomycetes bacterium]|nr:TetR/AcrR family transcriptional regulator [Planctomycetota bacterium]
MATRERLIQAGLDLFHLHGIHPVGLDRIINKAGVTKTTFYNYFESKENFACAVLDRFGEEVHTRIFRRIVGPDAQDAKQQLLNVFDAWDELFEEQTFHGCMLVAAGVASGDAHDPARQTAIRNKRTLLSAYEELAREAGIQDPARFAMQFGVLIDGTLIARHLYGDQAKAAREMVEDLIDAALAKSGKADS